MVLERQIERHGLVLPKDHSETQTDEETPDAKVRLFGLRVCNLWTDCIDVASVAPSTISSRGRAQGCTQGCGDCRLPERAYHTVMDWAGLQGTHDITGGRVSCSFEFDITLSLKVIGTLHGPNWVPNR